MDHPGRGAPSAVPTASHPAPRGASSGGAGTGDPSTSPKPCSAPGRIAPNPDPRGTGNALSLRRLQPHLPR